MSNEQHKSTPWKVGAIESGMVAIDSEDDKIVTGFIDPEDAQRILACVNACAGIPTEALEDGGIDKSALGCAVKIANDAIKQRDELLAALVESRQMVADALAAFGECDHSVGICNCDMKRSIEASDVAIASVKGGFK